MKNVLALLFFIFIVGGCTTKITDSYKYTGYEIKNKFKILQSFTIDYEVENGGPVFDNEISIYKLDKKNCVIVSQIDGDSGVYGTETILYFFNSKFLTGYRENYSYTVLNNEGALKSKIPKYEKHMINNKNFVELEKELQNYIKYINRRTLNQC